jgi:multiple sugar transport system permease protein
MDSLRWLMLFPAVSVLAIFTLVPLVRTIYMSLYTYRIGRPGVWAGLDNYERLLADSAFLSTVRTTLIFTVGAVTLQVLLGLAMALLLVGPVSRWRTVVRTLFLLPMVLSPVVVGIVWRALLNPQYGWINQLFGFQSGWLSDPDVALMTLVLVDTWQWAPFVFVILLSGLLGLPHEVLEAARIDGANRLQSLLYVTLPMLMPLIGVVALLRGIEASKMFDLVFNLTGGGPGTSTETIGFYTYRVAFKSFDQGYAAAVTVVLVVLVGALIGTLVGFGQRIARKEP